MSRGFWGNSKNSNFSRFYGGFWLWRFLDPLVAGSSRDTLRRNFHVAVAAFFRPLCPEPLRSPGHVARLNPVRQLQRAASIRKNHCLPNPPQAATMITARVQVLHFRPPKKFETGPLPVPRIPLQSTRFCCLGPIYGCPREPAISEPLKNLRGTR